MRPTGLPPPARYQSSAEGSYRRGNAPPTAGDPLITSRTHPRRDQCTVNTLKLHEPTRVRARWRRGADLWPNASKRKVHQVRSVSRGPGGVVSRVKKASGPLTAYRPSCDGEFAACHNNVRVRVPVNRDVSSRGVLERETAARSQQVTLWAVSCRNAE